MGYIAGPSPEYPCRRLLRGWIALARGFLFQSGHVGPLVECCLDVFELDAAGLQQHQQMKQQIGALSDQMVAIILDRGDHGFDSFLAEFFGAVLRTLVEQLAGVGRLSSRCGPRIDGGGQIMNRETRHQLNSTQAQRASPEPPPTGLSTFATASRQGPSRIGKPARTMCSLAWRMVNSPKW